MTEAAAPASMSAKPATTSAAANTVSAAGGSTARMRAMRIPTPATSAANTASRRDQIAARETGSATVSRRNGPPPRPGRPAPRAPPEPDLFRFGNPPTASRKF